MFKSTKVGIADLAELPWNRICADCHEESPKWSSLGFGVFICTRCSGIHRSLGTHLTLVRSVDLDKWSDEQIIQMRTIGNQVANSYWEKNASNMVRITPKDSDASLIEFITSKYVNRKWADTLHLPPNEIPLKSRRNPSDEEIFNAIRRPKPNFDFGDDGDLEDFLSRPDEDFTQPKQKGIDFGFLDDTTTNDSSFDFLKDEEPGDSSHAEPDFDSTKPKPKNDPFVVPTNDPDFDFLYEIPTESKDLLSNASDGDFCANDPEFDFLDDVEVPSSCQTFAGASSDLQPMMLQRYDIENFIIFSKSPTE